VELQGQHITLKAFKKRVALNWIHLNLAFWDFDLFGVIIERVCFFNFNALKGTFSGQRLVPLPPKH
jgi:hypothetical protein